jgi:hypothetical protein
MQTGLLLPAIVQGGMVLSLAFTMGFARFFAVKTGRVKTRDIAKHGWTGRLGVLSDSYDNQFQMPQLFYAVCIILTLLNAASPLAIKLAWSFVVLRFIHMIWHNTANVIVIRFVIFVLSGIALLSLFIIALMAAF